MDQTFITQIQLENILDNMRRNNLTQPSGVNHEISQRGALNLPRLKIEKLDGTKKEKYRTFITTFRAIIFDSEPDFKIQFIHLKQHVVGETASHISRLPINESMKALVKLYGSY